MNSLIQKIFENSAVSPDKTALIYNERTLSYKEFTTKIQIFAAALKERKLKKGSRIIIEADDLLSYFCALFGSQLAGCIPVPIEKNISIYKLQALMKTTKPALVFMKNNGESYADFFHTDAPLKKWTFPKKEDASIIISTTGTTGNPVLVSHTHRSMLAVTQNLISGTNITQNTVLLTNTPFHLAAGYRRILAALYCGATAVLTHDTLTLDVLKTYTQKYHVTFLSLINVNLSFLMEEDLQNAKELLKDIQQVESVTGSLSYDIILKFHNYFPSVTLYNIYGTTESGCLLVNNTSENYIENCIGKPTCNSKVFLLDENGEPITTPGAYGHIAIKGDMNMKEYYKKKGLTDKVLQNETLILNDIAYFDEQGYFYFVSRVGDIINVGGYKIIPTEIEQVAMQFEGVKDCACIAKDDVHYGQVPLLYIICEDKTNFDFAGLKAFLQENLESYRVPESIISIDHMPRTATGKLMRKSLALMPLF